MSNPSQTQELYKQTLMRLGSMLKLLKQGDSPQNREKIQSFCDYLSLEGRKQNLFGWVELMETAKAAIAKPQHNYSSTTKLIIKEIKEAGEHLIKGEINSIAMSDQLLNLAPSAKARFMDVETIYAQPQTAEEQKQAVSRGTLERDLWRETLFTTPEIDPEQELSKDSDNDSFNDDFLDTINDKTNTNLDDWLDEDSFGSENPMISSIFLTSKDTSTNSGDDFDDLFAELDDEDESGKVEPDQWSNKAEVETEELDEDWDFLDDDESEMVMGAGFVEEEDLSGSLGDLLDDLGEGIDFGVESTIEIPTDNNSRGTVIVDDPLAEVAEDWEDITAPLTVANALPLIYNNFEELDKVIVGENEHKYKTLTIDFPISRLAITYYDNFNELEKLVNTHDLAQEQVNWQELELMIADNLLANAKMTMTGATVYPESENLEAELSDLDRLLAQAEKSGAPKARLNKTPAPSTAKAQVFEQSMRVPVKQLDNLNNLVGEMVVRRNRLEEDQDKLRQFLDNLLSHVQGLSDVGARMQDMYERSLLEGALIDSRKRNQSIVKEQLARAENKNNTVVPTTGFISNEPTSPNPLELDELELDRFTGFHLLSQEIIELIVRVRESTSDIQFLVDETDQLGRNLRQITTQLQEQINKSRMVPFAQNADRLPLPIRKIAQSYNKQVQLKVEGRDVLIDKMILEHLWDPLLQIVKNSVTHGIEQPEERQANGKAPMGTITVRAFLQGPQTVISISDDGAGIDAHKVKQKAIQQKLITPAQAQNLKDQEVYEFLFNAGFTTKDKADSHAGRGVGLDIVRNSLNEIRGSVFIDSTPGQGTTFTIRLPLTLSIGKALCCLNDNARIAFPIDGIEDTQDFAISDLKVNSKGEKCIPWEDGLLPLRSLSSLLTYNRQITRSIVYTTSSGDDETIPVVILRGGNNLLAIQVDEVLGQEEIVIKQISGPLPKPKGIAGATVRSDGIVMAIGDVIELIEIAQGNLSNKVKSEMFPDNRGNQATMFDSPSSNQPFVLIVDDSITVREMLSMTFSKSGYRVEQARDGQEAWQKLKSGLPCDLIFSDIEMPRMNGLELLQHIQEDEELARIPVAILSSRGAQRHQKIAAELGASAYLIKPCVDKDLIDSAQRMVNGEVLLANSTRVPTLKVSKITENLEKETNSSKRRTSSAPLVLVIDDSVVVREMLSMTFKKAGYEVEQARDGQDAWDKISAGSPYDLLLCDIEMPRMNGLELLARMQQDEELSKLPVAMVTSRGAEKHRRIAADLGAKAYFTKPYLEDELLEAAQKLIKGQVLLS
ncbi:MAG: response regulator [Cyanobacterium sp. T60_A2020_053]|nr:response regulator [Cyanobacterium sp. T60_A2020_053]